MPPEPQHADLSSRAVIRIAGPEWRSFLQGLVTQDVETLSAGEIRFGALLTPQGRVLFDLFLIGDGEGCHLDCVADRREALIERLILYRLRANVTIEPLNIRVAALWGADSPGWLVDPRLAELGGRGYDAAPPPGAQAARESDYESHRLALGVPGPGDWGFEKTYPIEANFDLLNGVDFKKGCFVGQETTSRMKRRGTLKTRMGPIAFDGPAVAAGSELLAGGLRAGETHSSLPGVAMASLRLDRMDGAARVLPDGRAWRPVRPSWLAAALA